MAYTVKKNLMGKYYVTYQCPHCTAELNSPLEEAGVEVPCPVCGKPIVPPGKSELQRLLAERARQEQSEKETARLREIEQAANAKLAEQMRQERQEQRRQWRQMHGDDPSSADRFLAFAFKIGKAISVLVVAGCFITIAIFLLLILFVHAEKPSVTVVPFTAPSVVDYVQEVNSSRQATDVGSDSDNSSQAYTAADQWQQRYEAILRKYDIARVEYPFYRLDLELRPALVQGLEQFIKDLSRRQTVTSYEIGWYINTISERWKRTEESREQAQQETLRAEASASATRQQYLLIIGSALGALMSFLFLPLLIQIEQNTRRHWERFKDSHPASTST